MTRGVFMLLLLLLALACGPRLLRPDLRAVGPDFSGAAAAAHFRALAGLTPRRPGSQEDEAARAYLVREFESAGASVVVRSEGGRRHLVAELAGASSDVILLVAPYSALDSTSWVDDSGAALLLELAWVLASEPARYTLRFALAETRSPDIPEGTSRRPDVDAVPQSSGLAALENLAEARYSVSAAGDSLANAFALNSELAGVRAVIAIDVSARPRLRLARDLRSHPVFRALFWSSAESLGFQETFPADGGWASPRSLHLGFRAHSMDRVLALVDESVARADLFVARASGEPSGETLATLGVVSLDALDRLMARLTKIDAFSP